MTSSIISAFKGFSLDQAQDLDSEPTQADADLFSSALRSDNAPLGHLADGLMGALSDRIGSQDHLSQQAMRAMKNASGSAEPMDMVKMSRALSQYSLQMALTTKVVSKGAQTLDKLTNLQ